MNKHKSNKIKENSNTVRHLIMGQITTTQNLVAIKEVRHAGQKQVIMYAYNTVLRHWNDNIFLAKFSTLFAPEIAKISN